MRSGWPPHRRILGGQGAGLFLAGLGDAVMPETNESMIDLLVPELQRRGFIKKNIVPNRGVRSCLAKGLVCRKHIPGDGTNRVHRPRLL
jgi:hypothetical protein